MSQDRLIKLACSKCKNVNYWSEKRKKGDDIKKIVTDKYCKWCRAHSEHKESKK